MAGAPSRRPRNASRANQPNNTAPAPQNDHNNRSDAWIRGSAVSANNPAVNASGTPNRRDEPAGVLSNDCSGRRGLTSRRSRRFADDIDVMGEPYACTPPASPPQIVDRNPLSSALLAGCNLKFGDRSARPTRACESIAEVTMKSGISRIWTRHTYGGVLVVAIAVALSGLAGDAQNKADWTTITGGDSSTRYSPLDQINAENFNTLKVAWEWGADSAPGIDIGDINGRSLPIYVDGMLLTTSGPRRTVVSLDPATGKTLWTFQEPETPRHAYSMRSNHGKGVAYGRINGRGVVYVTTPGFFLHALDAKTGQPLENWGGAVPVRGFPKTGSVDLLKDLIADWDPWKNAKLPYDAAQGLPLSLGTSPPHPRRSSSTTC